MRTILSLLLLCAPLPAQLLNWGVKAGVPFNDAVEAAGNFQPKFHRWTLGPMVELNLPLGFGVEANAMYRKVGYTVTDGTASSVFDSNAWSFPILAKYKFPGAVARPYLGAGFVFRTLSDVPNLFDSTTKGFVMSGGVRFNLKLIKISPELRYTRWGADQFKVDSILGGSLKSKLNQMELLVGVTF